MISVFDVDALRSLLRDFYEITRIRITVFDAEMHEMVSYPEQRIPFCAAIRATEAGSGACQACDRAACAEATKRQGVSIYRCHAGLTEAVAPLHVGEVLVGYLWCGHVLAYPSMEAAMAAIEAYCAALPVPMETLRAACADQPLMTESYVRSAARILHATASYLILERMATLRENSVAAEVDAYLSTHFAQEASAEEISAALGLSRSRLYRLCGQLYGCGPGQHVRRLRMAHARKLLTERPELSIAEVAAACGFADYNYFIAVFSKEAGQPPNAFRKAQGEKTAVQPK